MGISHPSLLFANALTLGSRPRCRFPTALVATNGVLMYQALLPCVAMGLWSGHLKPHSLGSTSKIYDNLLHISAYLTCIHQQYWHCHGHPDDHHPQHPELRSRTQNSRPETGNGDLTPWLAVTGRPSHHFRRRCLSEASGWDWEIQHLPLPNILV